LDTGKPIFAMEDIAKTVGVLTNEEPHRMLEIENPHEPAKIIVDEDKERIPTSNPATSLAFENDRHREQKAVVKFAGDGQTVWEGTGEEGFGSLDWSLVEQDQPQPAKSFRYKPKKQLHSPMKGLNRPGGNLYHSAHSRGEFLITVQDAGRNVVKTDTYDDAGVGSYAKRITVGGSTVDSSFTETSKLAAPQTFQQTERFEEVKEPTPGPSSYFERIDKVVVHDSMGTLPRGPRGDQILEKKQIEQQNAGVANMLRSSLDYSMTVKSTNETFGKTIRWPKPSEQPPALMRDINLYTITHLDKLAIKHNSKSKSSVANNRFNTAKGRAAAAAEEAAAETKIANPAGKDATDSTSPNKNGKSKKSRSKQVVNCSTRYLTEYNQKHANDFNERYVVMKGKYTTFKGGQKDRRDYMFKIPGSQALDSHSYEVRNYTQLVGPSAATYDPCLNGHHPSTSGGSVWGKSEAKRWDTYSSEIAVASPGDKKVQRSKSVPHLNIPSPNAKVSRSRSGLVKSPSSPESPMDAYDKYLVYSYTNNPVNSINRLLTPAPTAYNPEKPRKNISHTIAPVRSQVLLQKSEPLPYVEPVPPDAPFLHPTTASILRQDPKLIRKVRQRRRNKIRQEKVLAMSDPRSVIGTNRSESTEQSSRTPLTIESTRSKAFSTARNSLYSQRSGQKTKRTLSDAYDDAIKLAASMWEDFKEDEQETKDAS